jgi:hypothetical protein
VVLSAVTARLVQGAFVLEDLGTHLLHGVGEPMMVSRVRGLLAPPSPDEDPGAWSARSGVRLHPGIRVVSAGRRDPRDGPNPLWAVAVLFCPATVADGARDRGDSATSGATC